MKYKDYYNTLGIEKDASQKDIKKAYRKLAAKYHPDKNTGDKAAEEKFKEINEANEVLSDPEKRKKYEQLGADWEMYQQTGHDPTHHRGRFNKNDGGGRTYYFEGDPTEFFGREGDSESSSFFDQFFGGGAGNRGGQRSRQHHTFTGQDLHAELDITLEEAYHGSSRMFELNGQKMRIKIKPGAKEGQTLRLKGKGGIGINGGQPGDLYLILKMRPHPLFVQQGDNLIIQHTIDLYTAILGGKTEVPTMSGRVKMNIPKGTVPNAVLRLKGKGMPQPNTPTHHGDLLVRIIVELPSSLTDEQEQLFEKLRELENVKSGAFV